MINTKPLISALVAAGCLATSGHVYASGFQISESSISGLGRAFAGAGVAADDVSDMFYNPAGMSLLDGRQIQGGLSFIDSEAKFSGSASPFGGPNDDGGEKAVVPNFFYTFDINPSLKFGLSMTAPFGLATEYEKNWAGRYQGIRSELKTIDINPAVSYQVNSQFAVGAGVSMQYAEAELISARFLGLGIPDGTTTVEGDNWAAGFNLGAVFTPSTAARIGLGYRSSIKQKVDGSLKVTGPTGSSLIDAGAEAEVTLPATMYWSGVFGVTSNLDILVSGRWTEWSKFDELRVKFDNGLPDNVTPENWDDTWTFSLGANYHLSNQWTLRAGYAKDESPTSDEFRTVRIPDSDRDWLTIGASYSPNPNVTIDFGYANLSGDDANINETTVIAGPPTAPTIVTSTLGGVYTGGADIFGVGFQYRF